MNLLPTPNTSAARQRVRRSAQRARRWLWQHREAVSWLLWALGILLCIAWAQRFYQPPAPPAWVGKTVRVTVVALCLATLREWLALRWGREAPPARKAADVNGDQDCDA
jgi:hypothetical protein